MLPEPSEERPALGNYVSTRRISRMLGCSERAVANWVDRGYIPAYRTPGGHRRIRLADVREFLRQRSLPIPGELGLDRSVLVASGDPDLFPSLLDGLAGNGIRVTSAPDIVSALIRMGDEKPGVVVLDLHLPGSDRYELCRQVRGVSAMAGVQVVILAPDAPGEDGAVRVESGAWEVLRKPVDHGTLRSAVTAALDGQGPT